MEQIDDGSTAVAFVTYFGNGDRKFIFHIGNTPAGKVKSPLLNTIDSCDFFHIMGCSLCASSSLYNEIMKTLNQFVAAGASISFDPNIRPELLRGRAIKDFIEPVMQECEVFLPGESELLVVSGENSIDAAVTTLFKNPKLKIIALKRGSKSCTIYSRNKSFDFGIYPVVAKDATGAGDCFDAAF